MIVVAVLCLVLALLWGDVIVHDVLGYPRRKR